MPPLHGFYFASELPLWGFLFIFGVFCFLSVKIQQVLDLTCYPREYFAPKDYFTGRLHVTKNTYSIHHYDSTWFTEKEQAQHRHDLKIARLRYLTYIPRSLAEKMLGTERYKRMVVAVKGIMPKGKRK